MLSPTLILLIVVAYVGVLYLVAGYAARRGDQGSFYSAERSIPWFWVAVGMIGAPMSGVSFVSVPGSVASDGFGYLQMVAGFTIGQVVIATLLLPLFYRLRVVSLYEYLSDRFGLRTRRVGAYLFLFSKWMLTAFKLLAAAVVLQELLFAPLGVPIGVNILLNVAIVWGYTRRGGVRSVVWTDILQTLCLVGAVVGTLWAIARSFELGTGELIAALWRLPEAQIIYHEPSTQAWWRMVVGGCFILIAMTGLDQDMMQRNLSCRTLRGAQRNVALAALCQALVIALLLTLGVALYRFAASRGIEASADDLFGHVALWGGLPRWVGVLFILGLISTTYSTAGSALTALTTSCMRDTGVFSKEPSQVARTRCHALMALLVALLMGGLYLLNDGSLIHLLYRVASYAYGPILGLFAFGLFTRYRLREEWVGGVAIASVALSLGGVELLHRLCAYDVGYELILYNALLSFGGLYLIRR